MEILLTFVLVGIGYVGFNVAHRFAVSRREKSDIEEQIASLRRGMPYRPVQDRKEQIVGGDR